ncbi:MAG: CHAT domain-containing protein [Pyrinomonadaceae bacterium]
MGVEQARGRASAPKTLAVLADPVFERSDDRLKARIGQTESRNAGQAASTDQARGLGLVMSTSAKQSGIADAGLRIPRLPGTRREADAIIKLVPPARYKKALDFDANRATATSPELGQYRYVHFATHGLLNSHYPELSGIALSMFDEQGTPQDGFWRAHEVFNLKLAADVVVLSACQTGLGKGVRGEGLISLTRGFMYAGAPRVMVSLWNVNDVATAELMTRFYHGILVEKLRPAKALQSAQVSILNEKRYSAPFYWAAFTLQGE